MIKRIPIIAADISEGELFAAAGASKEVVQDYSAALKRASGAVNCALFNSGAAALYAAFLALKEGSGRNEVILPAYTAVSVAVAARKAGLKVKLCDINLCDFGFDAELLAKETDGRTLAVVPVYLFGYKGETGGIFKAARNAGAYIIEDSAQSFILEGGSKADASVLSFNRGKNLTALGGGALLFDDRLLIPLVQKTADKKARKASFFKMQAFLMTKNPFFYGILYNVIKKFKEDTFEKDFEAGAISPVNAALGIIALNKYKTWKAKRRQNAEILSAELAGTPGLTLCKLTEYSVPNRYPVLVEDKSQRDAVLEKLGKAGIDASPMYKKPVHHWLDLGYRSEDFPRAVEFAEKLITLPVHPLLTEKQIKYIAKELKKCFL